MKDKIIIGLTGTAQSGKDTIADYMVKRLGFSKIAFADPMRRMLATLGLPEEYRTTKKDEDFAPLHASYRKLMQTLGDWGRNEINQRLWIGILERRVTELPWSRFVISDVRYENEARWLASHGPLWHVRRLDVPRVRAHSSEEGIPLRNGDVVIDNNRTIDDLHAVVRSEFDKYYESIGGNSV